jgi:hypothetical protein
MLVLIVTWGRLCGCGLRTRAHDREQENYRGREPPRRMHVTL